MEKPKGNWYSIHINGAFDLYGLSTSPDTHRLLTFKLASEQTPNIIYELKLYASDSKFDN